MFSDEEYEQMAIIAIRNYINKDYSDDFIKNRYSLAIKRITSNAKELENKPTGVVQATEGSKSITYKSGVEVGVITDDVKPLLPTPFVRCY